MKFPTFALGAVSSVVLLASGCAVDAEQSSRANEQVAGAAATSPPLPACTPDILQDTIGYMASYTASRQDLAEIPIAYQSGKFLVDNPESINAISQSTLLPCDPQVSLDNMSAAPSNVQLVHNIVGLDKWNTLIVGSKVGTGGGNGPAPTGFTDAEVSYTTFLNLVGRLPYLCGEQGIWASVQEACQREMASIFANGAQETGAHSGPIEDQYTQSLTYTREQGCYPGNCTQYDGGKEIWGAGSDAHFYGRGLHQLSYPYNYGTFSAIANEGDYSILVNNPDLVAQDPEYILGSALWFMNSPQPPKPSAHQVLVGTYKPQQAADGVAVASDGSVANKFEAVNSIINGGVECLGPATDPKAVAQSQNRFRFYKQILQLFGAQLTEEEQAINPGVSWCSNIINNTNGAPWTNPALIYAPPFYLDTTQPRAQVPAGNCQAVSWQPSPALPAGAPNMYATCKKIFFPTS